MTRLATMCPNITHLELSWMYSLSEAGRLSMVTLLRQIVQRNPPITDLNMNNFNSDRDDGDNIGEQVLEILLNSSIGTITLLNFENNSAWFKHPGTKEWRSGNVDLLVVLLSK